MRWLRIWTNETLQSTTFQELNIGERGIWYSLLVLAGTNIRNPGIVEIRDGVAYSIPTLAELLNCSESDLQQGLSKLQSVNKIKILPDGRILIVNWNKYQTRYEKYYKDGISGGISKGIKNGRRMQGRIEGDKEEDKDNILSKIKDFFAYFNTKLKERGWVKRDLLLTHARKRLIESRLKDFQIEDLKMAVDNFIKDDWPERCKYIDPKYCIGIIGGRDNLERWLNIKSGKFSGWGQR